MLKTLRYISNVTFYFIIFLIGIMSLKTSVFIIYKYGDYTPEFSNSIDIIVLLFMISFLCKFTIYTYDTYKEFKGK